MTVELYASEFPHSYRSLSTRGFYLRFVVAVALVLAASVFRYGWNAVANIVVAVVTTVVLDGGIASLSRRANASSDVLFSALVLCALLPPATPWSVVSIGCVVIVLVGKWTFGGVGSYWMHPAILAYVVIVLSGKGAFESWFVVPRTWPSTAVDWSATELINVYLFGTVGAVVDVGWLDLLFGNVPGPLGGTVIVTLFAGLFLMAEDVIPATFPALFAIGMVAVLLLGGSQEVFTTVFSGQVALAAFFLVPEPVSRAKTYLGLALVPLFAGAISGVFTLVGMGGASPIYGTAVVNGFTPLIDSLAGREYIRSIDEIDE